MRLTYYYLSLFPTEALIASNLDPQAFSIYMSTGSKRSAAEPLIFIELVDQLPEWVDTAFVEEKFEKRDPEIPNKSTYLSIYRSLENIPTENMGKLNLVTRDGKMLSLEPEAASAPSDEQPAYLYQELCPVRPLVASRLDPISFINQISNPNERVNVPRLALADINPMHPADLENAGNFGDMYYAHVNHLSDVVELVSSDAGKISKVLGRGRVETFGFNLINTGIYIGDAENTLFYPMKSKEELNRDHFSWAKSAGIV